MVNPKVYWCVHLAKFRQDMQQNTVAGRSIHGGLGVMLHLCQHGLSSTRGSIEQDALWLSQKVSTEQLWLFEREDDVHILQYGNH